MNFKNETHRISRYQTFSRLYQIKHFDLFVSLYDIDELLNFMPTNPNSMQKHVLNELIGVRGAAAYLDYEKSNNTFELITRFQQKTSSSTGSRNRRRRMR